MGSSPHTRGLQDGARLPLHIVRIIPAHAGFTRQATPRAQPSADHPRTRGVYGTPAADRAHGRGSSPHTRGLLRTGESGAHGRRIIPAHAGFTGRYRGCDHRRADHPRTRGVYCFSCLIDDMGMGSSPHTRGLRGVQDLPTSQDRIIPAHAGFTSPVEQADDVGEDHPRTRGVYPDGRVRVLPDPGSSPHTRGLHLEGEIFGQKRRIIPAHAGFTRGQCLLGHPVKDHPRTRGVYRPRPSRKGTACGSSPHTRGLLEGRGGGGEVVGIIPAHAGFTAASPPSPPGGEDHPRTRGVYAPNAPAATVPTGSSPHTRGLQPVDGQGHGAAGIIPAHAGFTPPPSASPPWSADHPRTRGVYIKTHGPPAIKAGSSPHTRGLRAGERRGTHRTRIIPAHAGFTSTGRSP